MSREITRRDFVTESVLASAGVVAGVGLVRAGDATPLATGNPPAPQAATWTGKIGKLELSRLMLGGNLISGYAHSRDLHYVPQLMRHYNTREKILETLTLAEQHGINSINTYITDDHSALKRYWKEHGRTLKWIVAANPSPMSANPFEEIDKAVEEGAHAIYIEGVCADVLVQRSMDLMKRTVEHMRTKGVPIGIGAHRLKVIVECEKAKLDVDFYQKTLHTKNYPTAKRPEEKGDFGSYDNDWCRSPEEVIEFMKSVKKPWIAFKVMAAGAISPREAFPYSFDNGADFILAGMFDFQIEEDTQIAKAALAKVKRSRPWS